MTVLWASSLQEKALWDDLLVSHPAGTAYLLSWYLQEQTLPRVEVEIAIIVHENRAVAGAALYAFRMPMGLAVCLVPSGPLVRPGQDKHLPELILALLERARQKRALLLQFEAFEAEMRDELRTVLADQPLRDEAVWKLYHPTTWRELRVDLRNKTPDSLLASFRSTSRQQIQKALKEGLTVKDVTDEREIAEIHDLWTRSAEERAYLPRPFESFEAMVRAAATRDMGKLIASYSGDKLGAFVQAIYYGSGSCYIAGAHDPQISRGLGHHLCHYHHMCLAIERGIPYYSLGGPGMGGLRRFKDGFRPVLVDNWRFVTVILRPKQTRLLGGFLSDPKWGQLAKKVTARRWMRRSG